MTALRGSNTTRRRGARIRALTAAGAFLTIMAPGASYADVGDTLCTVREALSILLQPCPDEAAPPQTPTTQTDTKTKISPQNTVRPAPDFAAPIVPAQTGRPTRTGATTPQSPPSAQTQKAPPRPVVEEPKAPATTAPVAQPGWKQGLAAATMTLVSGFVLWLVFLRPRRSRHAMQATEQLQRDIIANLTHELKTPMTPMVGYAQLIANGRLKGSEIRRVAAQMMNASQQLERRIDLLVTYATLRRGGFTAGTDSIDLGELVRDIAARNGNGRIDVRIDAALSPIRAEERLLRLSIQELVDNAVKFSPGREGVHVVVSRTADRAEPHIEISVIDNGIGMTPEDLKASFEAFNQLDPSSTRTFGGFGLGLTLASEIARLHGGEVRASSEPSQGSVFTLSIPERVALSSAIPVTHAA